VLESPWAKGALAGIAAYGLGRMLLGGGYGGFGGGFGGFGDDDGGGFFGGGDDGGGGDGD
jgi:single-strand DNA-binding protein